MTRTIRTRIVLLAAVPLLLPFGAILFVAANCEDDWCGAGIAQALLYDFAFSVLVVGVTAYLTTRGVGGLRCGLGGWSAAIGVFGLWFAASQFLERDHMVAMVWLWLGATLIVAAFVLGRPAPHRDRTAQEPGRGE